MARVQKVCTDKSRTQQNFKDICNINLIMKRWLKTGMFPQGDMSGLQYGDFTGETDYMTLQNKLISAENSFMSLPSQVRKRFNNNPAELLEFVADKANLDEAIKLGLVQPKVNGDVSISDVKSGENGSEQGST